MTNLERARLIIGGMFNRAPANVTNAQIDRCARGLAYRSDPISGLQAYAALSDADKVAWYVSRVHTIQAGAVAEMEAAAAALSSGTAARTAALTELTPDP